MIATIGVVVPLAKALTPAEASAPIPNCSAPSNDEAVPAFFAKGAIASAAAFGLVNPRQAKKTNKKKIVETKPNHPAIAQPKKIPATTNCPANATRMICWLVYRRSNKLLNWLNPINATDKPANTQP